MYTYTDWLDRASRLLLLRFPNPKPFWSDCMFFNHFYQNKLHHCKLYPNTIKCHIIQENKYILWMFCYDSSNFIVLVKYTPFLLFCIQSVSDIKRPIASNILLVCPELTYPTCNHAPSPMVILTISFCLMQLTKYVFQTINLHLFKINQEKQEEI